MPLFIVLLLLVPLIEIYLLIEVGEVIGALPTIGLCVLTALLGGALLKHQGLRTLLSARGALDRGEVPAIQLFEGMVLAVGGVLLMVPGFATDAIGFVCLLPFTRRLVVRGILARVQVRRGPAGPPHGPDGSPQPRSEPESHRTIEGEYQRRDQD